MKYRKKPVVIEAWQYKDKTPDEVRDFSTEWIKDAFKKGIIHYDKDEMNLFIDTLEGTHRVSDGDYIIKGINGELYPCKPDIFEKTYESVEE